MKYTNKEGKEMKASNYTMDVLKTMIDGLVDGKEAHGFRRLHNGLFEDCLGAVYSADVVQKAETTPGTSSEATLHEGWACRDDQVGVINHIVVRLKPVSIVGSF